MECTSIFDSKLVAAIIGAIIGSVLTQWIIYRKEVKAKRSRQKGWLHAVVVESEYICECIDEIVGVINSKKTPTKRLNRDLFEKARFAIFELTGSDDHLKLLTLNYRNIDHTNKMLDRLEASGNLSSSPNCISSLDTTKTTLNELIASTKSIKQY